MKLFHKKKNNSYIIQKYYKRLLKREPDKEGLNYFLKQMEEGTLDETGLKEIIVNSLEYKTRKLAPTHEKKKPFLFTGLYNISYIIHPNSALDHIVAKSGIYDKWMTSKLKKFIPPTGIIFDVGANVGLLSLPFAKYYVPNGLVYSFEPDSQKVSDLQENIKLNRFDNIRVIPMALQDNPTIDKTRFYRRLALDNEGRKHNALSSIESGPIGTIFEEKVFATTIDRYVSENNIPGVNLIKIDADGSDSKILTGGINTIRKFLPIIIYEYEVYIDKLINYSNTQKCFEFLEKKGYRQFRIVNEESLIELKRYDNELPGSNIVCFHETITSESLNENLK